MEGVPRDSLHEIYKPLGYRHTYMDIGAWRTSRQCKNPRSYKKKRHTVMEGFFLGEGSAYVTFGVLFCGDARSFIPLLRLADATGIKGNTRIMIYKNSHRVQGSQ